MKPLLSRHWRTLISEILRFTTDLLFPPQCVGCGRLGSSFCPHCAQQVPTVPATICHRCGRSRPMAVDQCQPCRQDRPVPLVWTRAATLYVEPLRSAIHALKYEGRTELAEPLARYLVVVFAQPPWIDLPGQVDACLPVPLHTDRYAERGYNQSALLAEAFAQRTNIPHRQDWLQRTRATASQTHLSAQERRRNVAGAFAAAPAVAGRRLLLIDDVMTTGSTLGACATALDEAGAAAVYGLVLAMPSLLADPLPHQMTG